MKAIDHVISAFTEAKRISAQAQTTRADIRHAFSHFGQELKAAMATSAAGGTSAASGGTTANAASASGTSTSNMGVAAADSAAVLSSIQSQQSAYVSGSSGSGSATNTGSTAATVTSSSIAAVSATSATSVTTTSGTVSPVPAGTMQAATVIPAFKKVSEMTEDWSNPLWVAQHPEAKQDLTMSYIESTGSTVTPQQAQDAWEASNDKSAPDFKANAGRVFAAQQLAALTPQQRADWNRVQEVTWAANHPSVSSS
ncbi:hypothetical protein ACO0LB_20095 [Undibacterium sp. SXout7W]|uniref:hypothetical protein n=1 Tax=Undibacterium sp. SXout7W TaxID=3413049 RepID=UPI003BF115AA